MLHTVLSHGFDQLQRRFWKNAFLSAFFLLPSVAWSQTAISSGGNYPGNLPAAGTLTYTFDGSAGDNVVLRVGSTNFVPRIDLFAANGTLLGSSPTGSPSSATRDTVLTNRLASSGSFRVTVTSFYANGSGPLSLHSALTPATFIVPAGDEGGALTNGALNLGTIDLGDIDVWSFPGSAGDNIQLRVGATNFVPYISLYGPDGALVDSYPDGAPSGALRDSVLPAHLAATGNYTVIVSSFYSGNSGGYSLTLAQAPESFIVSAGDSGGVLTNGVLNTGEITLGDLDMWTFSASAGDSIQLRMGATALVPRIDLYGPDGSLVAFAPTGTPSGAQRDTVLTNRIASAGNYTVVVSSFYAGASGAYSLTLARAPGAFVVSPGDSGGTLTNGVLSTGTLALGDLDLWSFTANAGDSIQLRMGAESLVPRIDLYGPDGALVASDPTGSPSGALRDSSIELQLTAAGDYTVVLSSFYSGNFGDYSLSFVRVPDDVIVVSPGDEGGPLTNGWTHLGVIDRGDVDLYRFAGKAGDGVELRMGATNLVPQIFLYGPDGRLVASEPTGSPSGAQRDTLLTNRLAADGTYTVAVSSFYSGNSGGYALTLVEAPGALLPSPGDEGGAMVNGFTYYGTNFIGDLDAWTFYGTVGDSNVFRIGTTTFTPWLRLYGPSGELVKEAFVNSGSNRTNQMSYVVTTNGMYTLTSSALFSGQQGAYNLKQSRVPPDIAMPAAVTIDEGQTLNIPISAQDPDVPEKTLTFNLQNAPAGVQLTVLGPTNAVITWATSEATGPSTNTFLVTVTDIVNVSSFTRTNIFTVVVNELNVAPVLTVPGNTEVNELTALNVSASATDVDLPKNPLTFSLIAPPAGMAIDAVSGAISWTPTEEQGPGTYPITVVVTDDSPSAVNEKQLSTTNTFSVTVKELNVAPQIAALPNQAIDEGQALSLQVIASDADRPANTLSYAINNPLPGLSINASGLITWTPSEAQGPATNTVTVVVTDSNPAAVNEQHLSATVSFGIVVREVNVAPILGSISSQTIDELKTLTVTNLATDADIPANTLTYALLGAPAGAAISQSGVITWTPTEAQGPTNVTFVTVVTDNGTPPLSVTNTFNVVVNEVNSAPTESLPTGVQTVDELSPFTLLVNATDSDLPANALSFRLIQPPDGMTISPAGSISWTPSEAQGPSTNTITVVVTDNNPAALVAPQISQTNSFTLVVNEVNSAPVIGEIPATSVHFGTLLTLPIAVTDADIPTNTVTLSLEGAPNGMVLANRAITWTPSEAQLGVYSITLKAADDGVPPKTASKIFQVTVTGSGARIDVSQLPNNLLQLDITADAGHTYELQKSTDLSVWEPLLQVPFNTPTYQHIEPMTSAHRFYRLKLVQ